MRVRTLACLCALLSNSALGQTPSPQPKAPDAPAAAVPARLYKDAVTGFLDYERRTLVDSYKEFGEHDAKWDAIANDFLQRAAVEHSDVRLESEGRPELLRLGKAALDRGCKDPLVKAVYASYLTGSRHPVGVLPLLQEAAEGLRGSKYCKIRQAMAYSKLAQSLEQNQGRAAADAAFKTSVDLFIAALTDPAEPKMPVRHADLRLRGRIGDVYPANLAEALCRGLEAGKADPWLVHESWISYYHRLAWEARGEGYAHTVTDEGWKTFRENMIKVREHAEAAFALHPEFPEPASMMIEVARDGCAKEGQDIWYWFDRTTAAEFDYIWAYNTMRFALRPRWGGDHQQMIAFGVRCAQTGRFDTEVPFQFIRSLEDVCDDMGNYTRVWKLPTVYDTAKRVLEGYIAARPEQANRYHSLLATVAWRCARYEDAKAELGKLKGMMDAKALATFRAKDYEIDNDVQLYTSPVADLYRQADKAGEAEDWARARELAEKALESGPHEQVGFRAAAMSRVAAAKFREQFEKGAWAELPFEQFTPLWVEQYGSWARVSDKAMRGTPLREGLQMLLLPEVGLRFELRGTMRFIGLTDPERANAGILFGYERVSADNPRWYGFSLFPGNQTAAVSLGWADEGAFKTPDLSGPIEFVLSCFDDEASLRINGDVVFSGPLPERGSWRPGGGVGLGGLLRAQNGSVEYSDLKARKLDQPPPPAKAAPRS